MRAWRGSRYGVVLAPARSMWDKVGRITELGSTASAAVFFSFAFSIISFRSPALLDIPAWFVFLRRRLCGFVFENDELASGRLHGGFTPLHLSLVAPALVERVGSDVLGAVHAVVEVQLVHEAGVWFGHGAGLAEEHQGGYGVRGGVRGEVVCDDEGRGAGFAHCAGTETSVGRLQEGM